MSRHIRLAIVLVVVSVAAYQLGRSRSTPPPSRLVEPTAVPRTSPAARSNTQRERLFTPAAPTETDAEALSSTSTLPALVQRAETSPRAALDEALRRTDDPLIEQTLERIGVAWARVDARDALERAAGVADPEQRVLLESAILREWAWHDAGAALDYIASLDTPALRELMANDEALRTIARIDPERITDIALRTGVEDIRSRVIATAAQVIARRDPKAALRFADQLRAGERATVLIAIAPRYGRTDPDGALAWVRTESIDIVHLVLDGIASVDLEHALALASELPTQSERTAAAAAAARWAVRSGDAAELADKFVALPDPTIRRTAVSSLVTNWAMHAPQEALDWLLAQPDPNVQGAFTQLGEMLGRSAPEVAQTYLARIPPAARADWLAAVATGYAAADPEGAATWLEQFRTEPGYTRGAHLVAMSLARRDPQAAARLLDTADTPAGSDLGMAVFNVAQIWAAKEPRAAAEWAARQSSEWRSTQAISAVLQRWASEDLRSAQDWAFAQPAGARRDAALAGVLGASDSPETERALLNRMANREEQERAVQRAAFEIAQRGRVDAARALVAAYVVDPERRRSLERALDSTQARPVMVVR